MPILIDIADRFEARLQRAILTVLDAARDRLPVNEVVLALEQRGVSGVIALLDGMEDDFGPVLRELDDAIRESGIATVSMIPAAAIINPRFRFDMFSQTTTDFIRDYRMNLISQISNETREVVRQALLGGFRAGQNPRTTARQLRQAVGLNNYQERALRNYRRALEDLDSTALHRAWRDKRFDRTVERAIREKKGLSKTQIDRMVERYRQKALKSRAETIARTETMRATSVGNRSAMSQMLRQGAIEDQKMRRQWVYTSDARTRDWHRAIPGLNEGGIALDGVYVTGLGPLRFPRDPDGSAENTINCRCTEYFFIPEEATS